MKMSDDGLMRVRVRIADLVLLLAATSVVGCVSLDKPTAVRECAATNTCSNDQQPGPDANQDTQQPGPDLQSGDKQTAREDLGPDSLVPDAPADEPGQGPETEDANGPGGKDTGILADADSGLLNPDFGPDQGSDTNRKDLGADLGPDVGRDLGSDVAPDLGSDLGTDLAPDLGSDLGPDLGPDLGADTSPDTSTLTSGLLAYYKCESASGTTLQDSSGKNNNGTLAAAGYTFAAGKVGNALTLAKSSSAYVTLPPAMFANVTDITIATWINVTTYQNWSRVFDVGVNAKIANNTPTSTHYLNFVPKTDVTNLAFAISKDGYNNEQTLTSAALAIGTWKHVAVVLGTGQSSLYVDGVLVPNTSTVSLRPTDLGTIDYAYLGKSQFSNDPNFDGQIDEFRVYGRALSATEILALFQFAGP
jgi:hypothetical protein